MNAGVQLGPHEANVLSPLGASTMGWEKQVWSRMSLLEVKYLPKASLVSLEGSV